MKLLSFLDKTTAVKTGILINENVLDITAALDFLKQKGDKHFPQDIIGLITGGEKVKNALTRLYRGVTEFPKDKKRFLKPLKSVKLLPPIPKPNKLLCLAGNYPEHIAESGFKPADNIENITPWVFLKPVSNTVIGDGADIILPKNGIAIDWEVELGVVIGKKGKYIKAHDADDFVYGYTIINDISERKFNSNIPNRKIRERDAFFDWLTGKWGDTFAPIGPWLVTKDEISNPHNLDIKLRLNGETMQDSNTKYMIFNIPKMIEYISSILTLEPGDIIATGTPEGVGMSRGIFLKTGDLLECEIESIGILTNRVVKEKARLTGY
jgi:2-keto-4-pentenoate hydratase/2-oxohepta-3-ene-1,7-dioic acid hydratase in catechol pathway